LAKFGVHLPSAWEDSRSFGELCHRVEGWGFDSIWLADGLTRNAVEPIPALAYAAAFTERVKLGTCIYVLPVRHPLITAKLTSALDRISQGRFILGVGVGWHEDEFRGTGTPFHERGRVTDECLQIITQAWQNGKVDFNGDFYQISGVKMEFQPAQRPRPQIWIGGNGDQAIKRAAHLGDFWIPTDFTLAEYKKGTMRLKNTCDKLGRNPGQVGVASHLMTIVDREKSGAEAAAKATAESLHTTPDELREWALVGDTTQVVERIETYNGLGVGYHVLNFGTKVRDTSRIELFAKEVLPSFT
jgi:probable F420-dependent oxidoreductase